MNILLSLLRWWRCSKISHMNIIILIENFNVKTCREYKKIILKEEFFKGIICVSYQNFCNWKEKEWVMKILWKKNVVLIHFNFVRLRISSRLLGEYQVRGKSSLNFRWKRCIEIDLVIPLIFLFKGNKTLLLYIRDSKGELITALRYEQWEEFARKSFENFTVECKKICNIDGLQLISEKHSFCRLITFHWNSESCLALQAKDISTFDKSDLYLPSASMFPWHLDKLSFHFLENFLQISSDKIDGCYMILIRHWDI